MPKYIIKGRRVSVAREDDEVKISIEGLGTAMAPSDTGAVIVIRVEDNEVFIYNDINSNVPNIVGLDNANVKRRDQDIHIVSFKKMNFRVIVDRSTNPPGLLLYEFNAIGELVNSPILRAAITAPNKKLKSDEIVIRDNDDNRGLLEVLEKEGIVKYTGNDTISGKICKLLIK